MNQPNRQSFERTYGWAWALKLAEELHSWNDADGKKWSENLQPLADTLTNSYLNFLPKQTYPIRTGVHPNTAFGLAFALDYAKTVGDGQLEALLDERSRTYYAKDVDYPGAWEPGPSGSLGRRSAPVAQRQRQWSQTPSSVSSNLTRGTSEAVGSCV